MAIFGNIWRAVPIWEYCPSVGTNLGILLQYWYQSGNILLTQAKFQYYKFQCYLISLFRFTSVIGSQKTELSISTDLELFGYRDRYRNSGSQRYGVMQPESQLSVIQFLCFLLWGGGQTYWVHGSISCHIEYILLSC